MSSPESSLDNILVSQENASIHGFDSILGKDEARSSRRKSNYTLRDRKNSNHQKYGQEYEIGDLFSENEVEELVQVPRKKKHSGSRVSDSQEVPQLPTTSPEAFPECSPNLKLVTTREYLDDSAEDSVPSDSGTDEFQPDESSSFEPDEGSSLESDEDYVLKKPITPRPKPSKPREKKKPREKTEKKSNPKLCHYCGKMYCHPTQFRAHVLFHELGHVPWVYCKICTRKFNTAEERDEHMKQHDLTNKNVSCKQCSEKFFTRNQLAKHNLKVHKGLQHVCEFCGKKFLTNHKMQKHISSIHGGPKNYMCSFCGKAYSQKCLLDYHLRSHSENKSPYICGYCPTSYTYKYTMLNHIKNKHSNDGKDNAKCCEKCLTGFFEINFEGHECKIDE